MFLFRRMHVASYAPFVLLVLLAIATVVAEGDDQDCEEKDKIEMEDMTILQVLQHLSGEPDDPSNQNKTDFDIMLRIFKAANLESELNGTTLLSVFVPTDESIWRTAEDIRLKLRLEESLETEDEQYNMIDTFMHRFAQPASHVLTQLARNHISPHDFSVCEFLLAHHWITWADEEVHRAGTYVYTPNSSFPRAQYNIGRMPIHTMNGIIHVVDRLIMLDFDKFGVAVSQSPTVTPTPQPSPSGMLAAESKPRVSASPSPSYIAPTPTHSAIPSITPIPSIQHPYTPFPSPKTSSPATAMEPNSSRGSPRYSCFPASALIHLTGKITRHMHQLQIGDRALSAIDKNGRMEQSSAVFLFTHRVAHGYFRFVRLVTVAGKAITLSHGHLLYVGRELQQAAHVRVGDVLQTVDGDEKVVSIAEVVEQGLYAPHTMDGDIVVDGVLTSCYTAAVKASVAHSLLAPVRAVMRTRLFRNPFGSLLDHGVHASLAKLVPRAMQSR